MFRLQDLSFDWIGSVVVVFEIFKEVANVQESVAIESYIHEGRLHAREHAADAALVEWWIGPELRTFGYKPGAGPPSLLGLGRGFAFGVIDAISRRVGEFPGVWYARAGSTEIVKEEAAKARFHHRNLTPANRS